MIPLPSDSDISCMVDPTSPRCAAEGCCGPTNSQTGPEHAAPTLTQGAGLSGWQRGAFWTITLAALALAGWSLSKSNPSPAFGSKTAATLGPGGKAAAAGGRGKAPCGGGNAPCPGKTPCSTPCGGQ